MCLHGVIRGFSCTATTAITAVTTTTITKAHNNTNGSYSCKITIIIYLLFVLTAAERPVTWTAQEPKRNT
jgi:hypothetical protein